MTNQPKDQAMTTNESVSVKEESMNEAIKAAANKFLGWKLPQDFSPDAGIVFHEPTLRLWPVGTNLLTATQAEAMFTYCLSDALAQQAEQLKEAQALIASLQAKVPMDAIDYAITLMNEKIAQVDEDLYKAAVGSMARRVRSITLANVREHKAALEGWITQLQLLPSTPATDEVKAEAVVTGFDLASPGSDMACEASGYRTAGGKVVVTEIRPLSTKEVKAKVVEEGKCVCDLQEALIGSAPICSQPFKQREGLIMEACANRGDDGAFCGHSRECHPNSGGSNE